jgi:type VI protein secretion system component VasK
MSFFVVVPARWILRMAVGLGCSLTILFVVAMLVYFWWAGLTVAGLLFYWGWRVWSRKRDEKRERLRVDAEKAQRRLDRRSMSAMEKALHAGKSTKRQAAALGRGAAALGRGAAALGPGARSIQRRRRERRLHKDENVVASARDKGLIG